MSELTLQVEEIKVEMEASDRVNLSFQHMQEAIHLAKMSKHCEIANKGKRFSDGDFWNHHRAYVVGSIMVSIACIEAKINEFYATELDRYEHLKSRHPDKRNEFIEAWDSLVLKKSTGTVSKKVTNAYNKPKSKILRKYRVALAATGCNQFVTSRPPYQDVQLLTSLRNKLIHFEPEWSNALEQHNKIEHQLRGKFELNPFFPKNGASFFPFMCMSYGCANWAVQSCMDFIFEFFKLTKVDTKSASYMNWKGLRRSLKQVQEKSQIG